jgi:hypothetical protein
MACENCFVRFRSWLRGVPSASTIRTKTADSPFQSVPSEGVTLTTGCGNPLAALATAATNCGCCANALAMYAKPLSRVLTGFCRARLLESLKLVSSKDRTSVAVPGRVTPYSLNFEPSQPLKSAILATSRRSRPRLPCPRLKTNAKTTQSAKSPQPPCYPRLGYGRALRTHCKTFRDAVRHRPQQFCSS